MLTLWSDSSLLTVITVVMKTGMWIRLKMIKPNGFILFFVIRIKVAIILLLHLEIRFIFARSVIS